MATRFYFHASGTPGISPTPDAGWEQTGQLVRRNMPRKNTLAAVTALADASAITVPITTTQQILGSQLISEEIFLPVRLDASVTFSMVIRGLENATTNNVFLAYVLRALSPNGSVNFGTLASSMTNAGTEFVATAATRIFSAIALTNTLIPHPWRLVLELGGHAQAPSAAGSYTYRHGCDAASDFALTSALTTDLNPWMELSVNLNAVRFNNHQSVKVGSGMSVGDRIR